MKIKLWEKFLTRFLGIVIFRQPPEDWSEPKELIMALHYCPVCREYRFDRQIDPLSHASRFCCGKCRTIKRCSANNIGISFFKIDECARIASSSKWVLISFFKLMILGLGKRTPGDRGGKTAGELESNSLMRFILTMTEISRIDKK